MNSDRTSVSGARRHWLRTTAWLCLAWFAVAGASAYAQVDLAVTTSDSPDPVLVGQDVQYTINVSNNGTVPATSVGADVFYSAALTFVPQATPGWSCNAGGVISCTLTAPSLAPGSAPALTLRFTAPPSPQTVQIGVTASAFENDPNPSNNTNIVQSTLVVNGTANLNLALSSSTPSAITGTPISFTANVSNAGPGNAPALQVSGTLSGAVVFSSFSVSPSWNCSYSVGSISCSYQGGSPAGTLASGLNAAPIVINGVAGPGVGTAQISLNATSAATDPSPATANGSIIVSSGGQVTADVSLSKTVIGAQPIPRDTPFTFRLVASNASGGQTATAIQINDPLPAGITLQSYSGAGWTCVGAVICSYTPALGIGQSSAPLDLVVAYGSAVPVSGAIVSNTATVSAAEADPVPGNNQATAVANIRASADVSVQLSGPASVIAGSSFNVDLSAANAGPDAAANVTLTGTVAAGFSLGAVNGGAGWSCLVSGQTVSCQRPSMPIGSSTAASFTLTAPNIPGGPFLQSAVISAGSFDPSNANNSASQPVTVTAQLTTLTLTKSDTVDPAPLNSQFEYVLTVTNSGNVSQSGISITDSMPNGLAYLSSTGSNWNCSATPAPGALVTCNNSGALLPGASSNVRLRVRADAAGVLTNNAQVVSAVNTNGASASETTTVNDTLALSFSKRARVSTIALGSNAVFDLNVGNTSQVDASQLVIQDDLPAGMDAVSASGDGWLCTVDAARVECRRPSLLRSTSTAVVVEARPRSLGSFLNRAQLAAAGGSPVLASDSVTVAPAPPANVDLLLDLSDSADPVVQGSEFDYLLRVRNLGPGIATAVRVTTVLPAGVQSLGTTTPGWTCQSGANVDCTLGGALAVGGESVLSLRVRATGSGAAVATANVSSAESDPTPGNNVDSETTQIQAQTAALADLQLSASGPASVAAGGSVEIVTQIRNLGPAAAATILLRAQASGPWSLSSGAGSGFACVVVGSNLECRAPALAPGAAVELRLQGQANASASSSLEAILAVSATTADPAIDNNNARVNVQIATPPPSSADLSITKVDSADPVAFGERYTYTLTARNIGPGAASGVVIRDPLPSGLTLISATGAGVSCTGGAAIECRASGVLASGQQLQVVVTVDAPDVRGTITNQATVSASTTDPVATNNSATQTTEVSAPEGGEAEEVLDSVTGDDALAGEAVAPVVDLCDGSTGAVSTFCDALYAEAAAGDDAAVQEALRSLYPEEVLSQFSSLNQLAESQYFNVDSRLSELRSGGGSGFNLSGLSVVNGNQAIPLGLLQGLLENADEPEVGGTGDLISPWGYFVNGSITRGDQQISSTDRDVVLDFDSIGITAGADYRRSARWVLGGAIGYNKFQSGLTDDGKLNTRGFTLTGYSAYYISDYTYFDTRLSYGRVSLDQKRRLRANLTGFTLDETLTGDTTSNQFTFATSVGHHISRGAWTFTPNGFVRYMRSSVDGFAEDGSSFAVRYSDQTVKSLVFGGGIQVTRAISLSNGVLVPQFDLVWNHESGNDDTVINASYVGGDPGEFFSLRPDGPDRSYGSVGFGLVYILANGKQAFLQWRDSIGIDGLDRSSLNLGARFEF